MKMRSVLASIAACAIAVSAMALPASAELMTKEGNTEQAKVYEIPTDGLDLSKLDKVEAVVSCSTKLLNGCIGYNAEDGSENGKWTSVDQKSEVADGEAVSATWTVDGLEGKVKSGLQVQFWWVQPTYDEDGKENGNGVAKLESVKLLDKSGNELTKQQETTAATTASSTTTSTTTTSGGTTTTTAAGTKTGDAGVGVAVAGLSLAAIAAFVARKKH